MTWVLPHPLVDYSIEILDRAQWPGLNAGELKHALHMIGRKAYHFGLEANARIHLWSEHDLFEPKDGFADRKPRHYSVVMCLLEIIANTPGVNYYVITMHADVLCNAMESMYGRPAMPNLIVGVPFEGDTYGYMRSMSEIGRASVACRFMITTREKLAYVDEGLQVFEHKPAATRYFRDGIANWAAREVHSDRITTLRVRDATDWLVVVGESIHEGDAPVVDHMRFERRVDYAGPFSRYPVPKSVQPPSVRADILMPGYADPRRVGAAMREMMIMEGQHTARRSAMADLATGIAMAREGWIAEAMRLSDHPVWARLKNQGHDKWRTGLHLKAMAEDADAFGLSREDEGRLLSLLAKAKEIIAETIASEVSKNADADV